MTGTFSMEEIITMEQRGQIRYKTQFSATLNNSNEKTESTQTNATVTNLSLSGLQLECDHEVMSALIPRLPHKDSGNPIYVHALFQVPTSQKSRADIHVECLIVYTRRLAQNRYVIGTQFKEFENHCETELEDYLRHFGERVDAPY